MSKNDKRWIVLLVAVITIAIILIVALTGNRGEENLNTDNPQGEVQTNEEKYVIETENGLKVNISEEFTKTRMYGDLEISNIQYTFADGTSLLLADVTNKGTSRHEKEIVNLSIIGENGEVITEIQPVIGNIGPGETVKLNASINVDLVNAKDFKIESID